MDLTEQITRLARQAKAASRELAKLTTAEKNSCLLAMADALEKKQLAGAAIDVFSVEPLPTDHPFRKLDNLVLTPHLGYVSERNYRVLYSGVVEDIRAWLNGKPVRILEAKY